MSQREVLEGTRQQGPGESIPYPLTTTNWGSAPSSAACTLYDISDPYNEVDVTSTKLTGSVSTTDDVITSPTVTALLATHRYRLEYSFVTGAKTLVAYVIIECEK